MSAPRITRIVGVSRLFSKEYFTRKTTPRKRTKPPIQAKSLTPRKLSQSIAARGLGTGFGIGGAATTGGGVVGGAAARAGTGKGGGVVAGVGDPGGGACATSLPASTTPATAARGCVSSEVSRAVNFCSAVSSALILRACAKNKTKGTSIASRTTKTRQVT